MTPTEQANQEITSKYWWSHAKDFEVESNAKCMQICEQIMKDYKCLEATPSYTETLAYLYNNDELAGQRPARMCSCYVRGCKE